jgi:hypothetical protein
MLNAPSQTEDKNYGTNGSLHEKLKEVFDQFPKPHLNIMLRDTNSKLGIKWGCTQGTINEKRKNVSQAVRSTMETVHKYSTPTPFPMRRRAITFIRFRGGLQC